MAGALRHQIEHVSRYRYESDARRCTMLLCLEPGADRGQRLLDFTLETRPRGGLSRERDGFGNVRHVLDIHEAHRTLEITARSTVESAPTPALPPRLGASAWREIRALGDHVADWDFVRPSPLIPRTASLSAFVERHGLRPGGDPLESLVDLSETLHDQLRYSPGVTSAESTVEDILRTDRGVCQDYAHAMIAIARSWGIPARYVSGYLHLIEPDGGHVPDNATHAWAECRLPELGWIGFDPTNRSLAGSGHVRIATGRDYQDVSPTRGIVQGGGSTRLEIEVRVR